MFMMKMIPKLVVWMVFFLPLSISATTLHSYAGTQLVSGIVRDNFDQKTRPQDNFYQYVNGGWLHSFKLPDDKSRYGTFDELQEQSKRDVQSILLSLGKKKSISAEEKKALAAYQAFMDLKKLDQLGASPIQPLLAEINKIQDKKSLSAQIAKSLEYGVETPLTWFVMPDKRDSMKNQVYFHQSGLGLPDRDYYLEQSPRFNAIRNAYLNYMEDMLKLAGYSSVKASAERVLALETQIAEVQWSRVENRQSDKTYNLRKTSELARVMNVMNWQAMSQVWQLENHTEVVIHQPSYIRGLAQIFKKTDLQSWKDYLALRTVSAFAKYLSAEFVLRDFEFYGKVLRGVTMLKPRWERGVEHTNQIIGQAVGKAYVKKHFRPEAKARMDKMVKNLTRAYTKTIQRLDWMSEETKNRALVKLEKFRPMIGFPEKWEDYSALELRPDDLFGNYQRSVKWFYNRSREDLSKPVDRTRWIINPQLVNAGYNPTTNQIFFPAGILQPPFFNVKADDAVNYGAIGTAIGHEISHGFDDQGAQYDGDGNLKNWWTSQDKAEFEKRSQRLIDQFNKFYPFRDAHVNGELTLGENIGDLSGVIIAFEAYKMSLKGKKSRVIDGFTGEQRFFLGFAQIWRNVYREAALRKRLRTDSHAPPQYRVLGTLKNVPAFYQAFDVKNTDKMYLKPEDRVIIW